MFDVAMIIGCAMPIGVWLQQYYLLFVFFAIMMLANLFLVYQLRVMQNIPTNPIFIVVCVFIYIIFTAFIIAG